MQSVWLRSILNALVSENHAPLATEFIEASDLIQSTHIFLLIPEVLRGKKQVKRKDS